MGIESIELLLNRSRAKFDENRSENREQWWMKKEKKKKSTKKNG